MTLVSCFERIPWGRRRNKTGQENNPRGKVRELSLESHIYPQGEKSTEWTGLRKKEEVGNTGNSRKFPLVSKREDHFLVCITLQHTQKMTFSFPICPWDCSFLIVSQYRFSHLKISLSCWLYCIFFIVLWEIERLYYLMKSHLQHLTVFLECLLIELGDSPTASRGYRRL